MAIIENNTGTAMQVDGGFGAARVSIRPPEALGWLSVGAQSNALSGAAANSAVLSFRNLSSNPVIVRRVGIGFVCTTGFTAAQVLSWGLIVARSFTVSDSGGLPIVLTGSNAKHRTSMATLTSVDARIAGSTNLGAGTKVLDTNHLAQVGVLAPVTTVGTLLSPTASNLFGHDPEDYPMVLAQNEGFNVMNITAMGAGGAGVLFANFEIAEVSAY